MKKFILDNVSLILLTLLSAGLVVPSAELVPSWCIPTLLGVVIFFACFKINFIELKNIQPNKFFLFYFLRFILVPIAFYYLTFIVSPTYAPAVFLLALLPAGTSSPAMTAVFNGNVALAFGLLIFSCLLAPFIIPAMIYMIIGKSIAIKITNLLITLVVSIFLPIMIFAFLNKYQKISHWSKENGSPISIILIGLSLLVATAKRKTLILHSPSIFLIPLALSILAIFLFYVLGWLFVKGSKENKIAFSLCSGANNLSLGIGIALLYFPPDDTIFLLAAEIPWILAFIPFKNWVQTKTLMS